MLARLIDLSERRVAGLISGTSLDGIDVAIARLKGSGRGMEIQVEGTSFLGYPEDLKQLLLDNSAPETSSVRALSQLNVRLGHAYAMAIEQACAALGLASSDLDVIGSHGQTVHHVPDPEPCAGVPTVSTFQIGEPAVIANRLGVPVVADFRVADMALGGEGAPLVPYLDYVAFTHPEEARLVLNLGGIANFTVLPPGARPDEVIAFDTGPSNMVMDLLTQRFFGESYDAGGRHAAQGTIIDGLLDELLEAPYFHRPPPKSTGREWLGGPYVETFVEQAYRYRPEATPEDLLATAAMLTARSIREAYTRFVAPDQDVHVVMASGGGVHNTTLMQVLQNQFGAVPVRSIETYGISADAKEALCFAVLAHEFLNGVPTGLPSVTGARAPAMQGKLCLPY